MPRIGAVVHGICVVIAIVVACHQPQVGMGSIYSCINDGDNGVDISISLRLIPGQLHVSIKTNCTYTRSRMASSRVYWELSRVIVTPVIGIIGVVWNRCGIGNVLWYGFLDVAVCLETLDGLFYARFTLQGDQKPAMESCGSFPGSVIHFAMGTDNLVSSVHAE
ncbi:hypothetical protein DSECCO2_499040 [anaerobic digester metagenome]